MIILQPNKTTKKSLFMQIELLQDINKNSDFLLKINVFILNKYCNLINNCIKTKI